MKPLLPFFLLLTLSACQASQPVKPGLSSAAEARLQAVAAAQSAATKARYNARHPVETLTFFGVEPGMTVVEILPGGGWYSSILGPYLGPDGKLIGVDYALEMMRNFTWVTDEFLTARTQWGAEWMTKAQAWPGGTSAELEAYSLATLPARLNGTADAVLFIRALHNLSRFEPQGAYRTEALRRTYELLKPGGIVGVVQHQVDESRAAQWADGSQGYMRKSDVIRLLEDAGFEFVAESPINENPRDQPGLEDNVWRLPPSLSTSQDDPAARVGFEAIGESNRMTLLFAKPQ